MGTGREIREGHRQGSRVCWLFLGLSMSLGLAAAAQTPPDPLQEAWRWARYDANAGLPAGPVMSVVETTDGVAWAMTETGLAWYDEYRWHPVRLQKGSILNEPSFLAPDLEGGVLLVAGDQLFRVDQQGYQRLLGTEEVVVRQVAPLARDTLLVLTPDALYRQELRLDRCGHASCDVVLQLEDVREFAIVILSPMLHATRCIYQLGGDSQAISRFPHTAL